MAGKKLLVADDSATIQKVIRLALAASSVPGRDRHYEIQSVSDGNDLLRHLGHSIPDAILIDVSLPQKSAYEIKSAVEKMGARFAHIRFILLVGSDERIDDSRLRELGFSGVLSKPFEPSHLRQVLADALESTSAAGGTPAQADSSFPPMPPGGSPDLADADADALPPPPLDFGEEDSPPALPLPEDAPPALPSISMEPEEAADADLWSSDEEERLQNATRNIEIRLQAPEVSDSVAPVAHSTDSRTNPIEEDIRKLAETTLRLSGIEDSSSKDSPLDLSSIFPEKEAHPPAPPADDTGWAVREPSRGHSRLPRMTPPPLAQDLGGATFPRESLGLDSPSLSPGTEEPSVVPLSLDQMEQILERQLRATLQSMAERMLPEIATRILKDEIHKMLTSENP